MREVPFTVVRGFCMGAADIVPGVSGGTVALVFAIYERMVASIRSGSSALGSLLRLDPRRARQHLGEVEWVFLVSLLAGIGAAVLSLSHVISNLLDDHPVEMAGLFTGLVAGSVVVAWQLLRRRDGLRVVVLGGVAAIVFVLLGIREGTSEDAVSQVTDPSLWAFFGAGAIAICAMILPGISGSFILVILGMYAAVLDAVNDRDLVGIAAVGLGCVIGLAVFSQVLHWALAHHYDTVMAALIGLMLGSLRVLWPWPQGVDSTRLGAPAGTVAAPVMLAVAGLVAVVAVNEVAKRLEHRTSGDEAAELRG